MDWKKDKDHKKECNCRIKIEKSKVIIICDDDFDINCLETFVEPNGNGTSPNVEE